LTGDAPSRQAALSPASVSQTGLHEIDAAMRRGEISVQGDVEPALLAGIAAKATGLNPGVGYSDQVGRQACFDGCQRCWRIGAEAPWGPTGDGPLDQKLFEARYFGGARPAGCYPRGMAAELYYVNALALTGAYLGECSAIPLLAGDWTGTPTEREQYDLAVSTPRCSQAYRLCWWDVQARTYGGGMETPHLVTEATWRRFEATLEAAKVCTVGVHRVQSVLCGWPIWYDVEWLPTVRPWCVDEPDEPDEPDDSEPDDSDCPSMPTECSGACSALADRIDQALSGPRRSILPDGSGQVDNDGRYQFIPGWLRESLAALAGQCRDERDCYRPGIPSTGKLDIELIGPPSLDDKD
jgi:hypothetical protein